MFSLEEDYWWYRALRRRIARALERAGALPSRGDASSRPPRCLDAGCGSGMVLASLMPRVRAFGLDASPEALALARSRDLTRLLRAGVEALPLKGDTFDIMISADVLYHRGVADDRAALREAGRCLRPGGVLVVNLPAFSWLRSSHDEAIHTARRYTAREVRAKLRAAGLRPLRVRYWNSLLFPLWALIRLMRRPGRQAGQDVPESDLAALPRWLNRTLEMLLALEEACDFIPWPAGLSILAVARKEEQGPPEVGS